MKWIDIATKDRCKVNGKAVVGCYSLCCTSTLTPRPTKVETGCKCFADCGYVCEGTCNMDAECKWEDDVCIHRASGQAGTKVQECAYTWSPTVSPTVSNLNKFALFSPKLVVDTTPLPGDVLTGKQGLSLAMSNDVVLVGAPMDDFGTGNVFHYSYAENKKGVMKFTQTMLEPAQRGKVRAIATSLALSADGTIALFGAPYHGDGVYERGAGFIYRFEKTKWVESAALIGYDSVGDSHQGQAVALSGNGLVALVGAKDDNGRTGAAWLYKFNGTHWNPLTTEKITAPSQFKKAAEFGTSVSLNFDGSVAMIGAPSTGIVLVYSISKLGSVSYVTSLQTGNGGVGGAFGASISINAKGTLAVVGAPTKSSNKGGAVVYETTNGLVWKQVQTIDPTNSTYTQLGSSVAMSADGTTILVAGISTVLATTSNQVVTSLVAFAHVRTGEEGKYVILDTLIPTETRGAPVVGLTVALNERGTMALLGSPSDDEYIGAAWMFRRAEI